MLLFKKNITAISLGSWNSSIGIATSYRLDGKGSILGRKDFSLLRSAQTVSGVHSASYPMGTGRSFRGGTATGA
jgi:hypothetical protein